MTQPTPNLKPIEPLLDEVLGIEVSATSIKTLPTGILQLFMDLTSPRREYSYSANTISMRYTVSKELSSRHGSSSIARTQ